MNSSQDLLSLTAFLSALFHAVIILGVSFKLPEIASIENTDNTLDVVLINQANNEAPDDAETVSTNDNQGGGLDEQEASSPLPYKPVNVAPIESIKLTADQEKQTTLEPDKLVAALESDVAVTPQKPEKTRLKVEQQESGEDKISTKSVRQLERERLIAKLQQNWQDYQKKPRKEFLSPTTKKNEAARYLDQWRKKVEQVGNANYPIQAKAQALSGSLILSVELNRNGTISSIAILKPSPHKVLNDAALRFVRDASPYASFPEEIDPDTDILVITRAFHFLGNNRMSSTDASSQL
jgi:protein TonB